MARSGDFLSSFTKRALNAIVTIDTATLATFPLVVESTIGSAKSKSARIIEKILNVIPKFFQFALFIMLLLL